MSKVLSHALEPLAPCLTCREFTMPTGTRSGSRRTPRFNNDALGDMSTPLVEALARQKARDYMRAHNKTPIPDRTGRAPPASEGYESSDLDDEAPEATSTLETWTLRKLQYKRNEKRAAAISVKLGQGVVSDLLFWYELSKLGRTSDYRHAVDHASDQNESLGDYQPPSDGYVSAQQFKLLMHSYMLHRHAATYLEEVQAGVIHAVEQAPGETIQTYKLRADRLLQALLYLFDHDSVNDRERALLSNSFIGTWIEGLHSISSDSLATRFLESTLANKPLSLQEVYSKALAAASSKRSHKDNNQDGPPRKRLAGAAALGGTHDAAILPGTADIIASINALGAKLATGTNMPSKLLVEMDARVRRLADTIDDNRREYDKFAGTQTHAPQQRSKNGGGGSGPVPPPLCRTCERKGLASNHKWVDCNDYHGCHVCGRKGHAAQDCTAACPSCKQDQMINGKRHVPKCDRIPRRR